ncbi:hypothetical protein VOLCADRAFT_73065 [Volvox carteri f. nagariensis]|uniref:DNA/RNA-binding protein Alba-like domain-containing protein n=1 Tax=Volvox carteri f. nagariensis TaxID=3068 RepID=D8TL42_VOLCA|nr:uncharacterized protein VOLCADRAFT_73065 [Volvox carteri f. nagariensis]EFJ51674.1 hypothetical protein VOLCADRAFT_73065 [Volvox carteri f. nagariensis]|eukprot:XP_002947084.1 hypothetical protein VOLCADRAFT_73065 [Volvox carteri f. nagariensis]
MATDAAPPARQPNRVQVSTNKKPLQFYLNLSRRIMAEHGEVELSALGLAVSNMVTVAEILKKEGWAVEKSLRTGLETLEGEQRSVSKPKMEVVLTKSPDFDRLFAEHPPPPRGQRQGPPAEAAAA